VLLISPASSDASRLVREHTLGRAFAGGDIGLMAAWLAEQSRTIAQPAATNENGRAFSWPQIAAQLDAILRQFTPVKT
jgi:hypothetical protein